MYLFRYENCQDRVLYMSHWDILLLRTKRIYDFKKIQALDKLGKHSREKKYCKGPHPPPLISTLTVRP